jgi:hypothetical protein
VGHGASVDRWHRKSGIGDPKGVSSVHFDFVKPEFSIGNGPWSRGLAGHVGKGLARGAKTIARVPLQIGFRGF